MNLLKLSLRLHSLITTVFFRLEVELRRAERKIVDAERKVEAEQRDRLRCLGTLCDSSSLTYHPFLHVDVNALCRK